MRIGHLANDPGPGTFRRCWLAPSKSRSRVAACDALLTLWRRFWAASFAIHLRLDVLARAFALLPNQSAVGAFFASSRASCAQMGFSGPMIRFVAGRTHVAPVARWAFLSPDASHEVFVPSAFTGRDALCGAAGPGRSRFGVVRLVACRASTALRFGVALAVFRSANVVRSGLMRDLVAVVPGRFARIPLCGIRRVTAAAKRGNHFFDRLCRRSRCNRASRSLAILTSSAAASRLPFELGSFAVAFLQRGVPYACSNLRGLAG